MDIAKSFGFVFDDNEWIKKVLLGGIISIVPILNFAAFGYALEVTRRVINGDANPMPEWDDLGGKLVKGLIMTIISLVYMLPVIALACLTIIPASIISENASGDGSEAFVALLSTCGGCLVMLCSIAIYMVLPAAIAHYAVRDEMSAAFRFADIFGMVRKNLGPFLLVMLMALIVVPVVASLGLIACAIGAAFTGFYSYLILAHVTGQAYRQADLNVGLV